MMKKPQERDVYQGRYITVTEEQIHKHCYERVHLRSGVQIIPFRDNHILLIREYRVHEGRERWKLVSGWIDKEEKTPQEIAQEELAEEVGMRAEKWTLWKTHDTHGQTIGTTTYYFIAQEIETITQAPENPDHDEVREMRWVSQGAFQRLLRTQQVMWDTSALYVLQFFLQHHQKRSALHKK